MSFHTAFLLALHTIGASEEDQSEPTWPFFLWGLGLRVVRVQLATTPLIAPDRLNVTTDVCPDNMLEAFFSVLLHSPIEH